MTPPPRRNAEIAGRGALKSRLLRDLPESELRAILDACQPIELRPRHVLHHWNLPLREVYFIEHGLISVAVKVGNERSVEGWLIGSEGMTGIPVLFGNSDNAAHRHQVLVGGRALRLDTAAFVAIMQNLPQFRRTLDKYALFLLWQASQCGACNAQHSLSQRTARWLLAASDALESPEIPITHQAVARALGIRRASVTDVVNSLEQIGAIRHWRAFIEIADVECLQPIACDCHRLLGREYRRLFG